MTVLTVTSRGQVTLRRDVLAHLGIKPGDKIEIDLLPGGRAQLSAGRPKGPLSQLNGLLTGKTNGARLTVGEIEERASLLFAPQQGAPPSDPRLRVAHIWREVRDKAFPGLPAARDLFWLFLLTELLRRLTWHTREDGGTDTDTDTKVGATVPEILAAIRVLLAEGNVPV